MADPSGGRDRRASEDDRGPVPITDGRDDPGPIPITDGGDAPSGGSGDLADAVETFLAEFGTVCEEYDRGYMDADAALERIRSSATDLEAAFEDLDR